MEIAAATLLGPLQTLLKWFQENRVHKNAEQDAALEAINKALFASMSYSEEQRTASEPDRKREFELAEMWANAAAKVRRVSSDLSNQLQDKSIYWSNEIKWSREEVLAKRIDFETVQHEIKKLLNEN